MGSLIFCPVGIDQTSTVSLCLFCPSGGCHQNILEKFTMVYKSDIKLNLNLKIFNRIYIDWTLGLFVGDESMETMSLNKF